MSDRTRARIHSKCPGIPQKPQDLNLQIRPGLLEAVLGFEKVALGVNQLAVVYLPLPEQLVRIFKSPLRELNAVLLNPK